VPRKGPPVAAELADGQLDHLFGQENSSFLKVSRKYLFGLRSPSVWHLEFQFYGFCSISLLQKFNQGVQKHEMQGDQMSLRKKSPKM
jgi:hypothetical protein